MWNYPVRGAKRKINKIEWRKSKGLTQQYQEDQYTHYESQKEQRKIEAKSLFKEIMAENFPNLGKEMDIRFMKSKRL